MPLQSIDEAFNSLTINEELEIGEHDNFEWLKKNLLDMDQGLDDLWINTRGLKF